MKPVTYNRPRTHKFKGEEFKILWKKCFIKGVECDGTCSVAPKTRTITINPNLSERRLLKVLIDESIHACCWDLDNDSVGQYSDAITSLLWKVGYRLPRIED